ncbi:MAG: acetyltransferase [Mariprofundaceae bacterium]
MFLKDVGNGDLVDVLDVSALFNPNALAVQVRYQAGEEQGDPVDAVKTKLVFPSGEALPECWKNAHYRIDF